MTIEWRVLIGDKKVEKERVQKIIDLAFREINEIYNRWNPDSELSQLNKSFAPMPISEKLQRFLLETDAFVKLTGGKFDPSVNPLTLLWKESLSKGSLPETEKIQALLPALGWENISFHEGVFTKVHPMTSLDLGGIAKGYAVDLILERLKESGLHNIYVEWGGEIRAFGKHPEGRAWRVSISQPRHPSKVLDIIELNDQALATSGDYEQYWQVGDKTYSHILDPRTGFPFESPFTMVTVLAPTCLMADALATAAMMFSTRKEAEEWALSVQETFPSVSFWFLAHPES